MKQTPIDTNPPKAEEKGSLGGGGADFLFQLMSLAIIVVAGAISGWRGAILGIGAVVILRSLIVKAKEDVNNYGWGRAIEGIIVTIVLFAAIWVANTISGWRGAGIGVGISFIISVLIALIGIAEKTINNSNQGRAGAATTRIVVRIVRTLIIAVAVLIGTIIIFQTAVAFSDIK